MRGDYVKIHRSSLKSWVFADADIWRLWSWCLMRANFRSRDVTVRTGRGTKIVTLKAGQFIYGRLSAAKVLGWTASSTKRRMDRLQKSGSLKIEKADSHYSIVTVVNWRTYQEKSEAERTGKVGRTGQATGQANGQATGQATEHRQERLEERLEECTRPSAPQNEVLAAWNATPGTSKAIKLTTARDKTIRTRLTDQEWRDSWKESLAKFPLKCFSSDGSWTPTLDWFIRPDTVTAILEGKYDWSKTNGKPDSNGSPARVREREFNAADVESRTFRSTPVAADPPTGADSP